MTTSLGDRIKKYELITQFKLIPNSYIVLRVDGKAFHTFTRGMNKPFDDKLINAMTVAAQKTSKHMMGFRLAYCQSDECTFVITDTMSYESELWFDGKVQKLCSVTASLFTAYFNKEMDGTVAAFDCRVFNVPKDDVANVFVWRQQDWERNSIQMYTRSIYSHNACENKSIKDMHEMLYQKELNWCNLKDVYKNGIFVLKDGNILYEKLNYNEINKLLEMCG